MGKVLNINKFYKSNEMVNKKTYYNTKEFRCPKKGEYYLSGARPCAYKAPNDLSTEFYIARPCKVVSKTIIQYKAVEEV